MWLVGLAASPGCSLITATDIDFGDVSDDGGSDGGRSVTRADGAMARADGSPHDDRMPRDGSKPPASIDGGSTGDDSDGSPPRGVSEEDDAASALLDDGSVEGGADATPGTTTGVEEPDNAQLAQTLSEEGQREHELVCRCDRSDPACDGHTHSVDADACNQGGPEVRRLLECALDAEIMFNECVESLDCADYLGEGSLLCENESVGVLLDCLGQADVSDRAAEDFDACVASQ